ncbi:hypothetical protein [Azospirillum rugosum]|uniref:Transposase, Mutator family n=1 Tax=Azospirillum rugosum TaxID=416170 RepID=A0ABS4STA1_9PROT|nr:hypothetical protein [Azospirillum rugosum]MBP2295783.1 hypothetical protein [Azospirillum rugosum]MDQ0529106.1 hypothetical protein [Azospirillum rugosum]
MRRDARQDLDRLTAALIVGLLQDVPPERRERWEGSQIFGRIIARARCLSKPEGAGESAGPSAPA